MQASLFNDSTIFPKSTYSFKKEKLKQCSHYTLSFSCFSLQVHLFQPLCFGCHFSCFEPVCPHDSDGHPSWLFSSSAHRCGNVQTQPEVICRQWLVTAPEANLPVPSGACLSFTCRGLHGTCLPLPPPSPTHTHTHIHTHTHTLLWASANSGQGSAQLKLIRTLGNDSVNTRSLFLMIFSITKDFPLSHACLFFQIARKDINNVILPSK